MVIEVKNLKIEFRFDGRISTPVRGVSFSVPDNGRVAIVGESGCGKSLTALALGGLVDNAKIGGEIIGSPKIAYVFQNPMQSLNPVIKVGKQILEAVENESNPKALLAELMTSVGLPVDTIKKFPCQLSGGQQQRVMIAMALAAKPDLLIADEPTTALDVTTQKEVLDLIERIAEQQKMAVLLITHNLGLVARYSKEVNVMYAGEIVERGDVKTVLENPRHPYTRGLIGAVPRLNLPKDSQLSEIKGTVPPPWNWPSGCAFHPRCQYARKECEMPNFQCLELERS